MRSQEPAEEVAETVFVADYPLLAPTGKGKVPKIPVRPTSKKKPRGAAPAKGKTPKGY